MENLHNNKMKEDVNGVELNGMSNVSLIIFILEIELDKAKLNFTFITASFGIQKENKHSLILILELKEML